MENLKIIAVCLLSLVMIVSCNRYDDVYPNKIESESNVVHKAISSCTPLTMPSGWTFVKTTANGKGKVWKKNSNTYVVAMNLTAGDIVARPLYNTPIPSSATSAYPNPTFQTGNVIYWDAKDANDFAIANSSFFAANYASQNPLGAEGSTTLPHVLKRAGTILASGSAFETESYQRYLVLGQNGSNGFYSEISDNPGGPYPGSTLYIKSRDFYSNKGNTIIGGLHPLDANKNKDLSVARTMVGIKDCNGDGYKEELYILVAKSLTQIQAYNILRYEYGCDQTIMFDGDGSSQLSSQGTELITSTDLSSFPHYQRRKFPIALQVITN